MHSCQKRAIMLEKLESEIERFGLQDTKDNCYGLCVYEDDFTVTNLFRLDGDKGGGTIIFAEQSIEYLSKVSPEGNYENDQQEFYQNLLTIDDVPRHQHDLDREILEKLFEEASPTFALSTFNPETDSWESIDSPQCAYLGNNLWIYSDEKDGYQIYETSDLEEYAMEPIE